jgi:hypothetical protein
VVLLGVECNIYRVLNAVVVAINWTTVAKSSVHGGAIVAFNRNAVAVTVAARLGQIQAGVGELNFYITSNIRIPILCLPININSKLSGLNKLVECCDCYCLGIILRIDARLIIESWESQNRLII